MISDQAEQKPFVVAVSGVPGSGKTTLIQRVLRLMPSASPLYFDCYQSAAIWCPNYKPGGNGHDAHDGRDKQAMLQHWLDSGAAADDYVSIPQMQRDLLALTRRERVIMPQPTKAGEQVIDPADFIIVEDPFGRERSEIGPHVDFVVHLEAPLDIALGRCVLRASRRNVDPYHFITGYLRRNITHLNQRFANVRCTADIILNADQRPMIIARQMRDALYEAAEAAGRSVNRAGRRPNRIVRNGDDATDDAFDDATSETIEAAAFDDGDDDDQYDRDNDGEASDASDDATEKSGVHGSL